MSAGKILVVDDDPQIRRVMKATLVGHSYEVIEARTGEEALEVSAREMPNLVLLDMNMPGMGGLETCRALRGASDIPVIILSVRNTEKDKVAALDAGADDYVTKPFSIEELLARIRAALRRSASSPEGGPASFTAQDLEIDFETRRVRAHGEDVRLTPKEFELLRYLVAHAGKPVTHRELLQAVWGPDYGDEPEYLRVFINQVRKKIEPNPARPKYILTEPWVGYKFVAPQPLNPILIVSLRLLYVPLLTLENVDTHGKLQIDPGSLATPAESPTLSSSVLYTESALTEALLRRAVTLDGGSGCQDPTGGRAHGAVPGGFRMPGRGARPPGGATG